ncbi:MAG: DpnI domain-containing protein [Oscillospiraceae bacterium]|nr:DpnI domain-containing protein [Oscillospiraceae bacterium]
MELDFDKSLADGYKSGTQRARRLTEGWVEENMFCPRCGAIKIARYENNRPVADFVCPVCRNQYELKSKLGRFEKKITDGAYATMIERIMGNENPDFFLMSHNGKSVSDFIVVPKHFFVPEIIEKRRPLSQSAKRAGWMGCNILLDAIPKQGRIFIVRGGKAEDRKEVSRRLNGAHALEIKDIAARGWLLDVLACVNAMPEDFFTLRQIYGFENELMAKHGANHNVRAKIRQQLQILRDRGYVEFLGRGNYRRLEK